MHFTKRILLLWSCAALPAFSSGRVVEESIEVSSGEIYLPKSLSRCQAALSREYDFLTYLKELASSLESETRTFNEDDEIQIFIKRGLQKDPGSQAIYLNCIQGAISCSEGNLSSLVLNIKQITNVRSWEDFQNRADDDVKKYDGLLNGRIPQGITLRSVPSTVPNEMDTHNPINRLLAQVSIDYHSLRSMFVKESYQKMKAHDEVLARAYLKKIGPQTALGRYVQKELKEIPDPDTCLVQDGKMRQVSAATLLTSSSGPTGSSPADKTRQRLQQKLAQKKGRGASSPTKPVTQKKRSAGSLRSPLSASTVAVIKSDVEIKIQEAAAREEDKRRRALADQKRAQAIKEMLHKMRADQAASPEAEPAVGIPLTVSSTWTAPTPRMRKKTKGVAGPARTVVATPATSFSSSHDVMPHALTAGVMRRLEVFWESKAGLTYHEVASLFTVLGGRISEKGGGSSHVTLSYFMGDAVKFKHELWRPHGKGNTFGFRTMTALRQYFERCGLTLKD